MRLKLLEVSRKNLVGKTKVQSPERFNKRLRYSTMTVPEIDEEELLKHDMLVISVGVGAYNVILAYEGVMKRIIELCKSDSRHILSRRIVIRAMNDVVDETDVYVRCSCPDFRYRYAYQATRHDYLWGSPEHRPADVTNPHDNIGATCKHLACVLANKKWLVKASTPVNDFIHDNFDAIKSQYNINEEEFLLDAHRYAAGITRALNAEKKKLPTELLWIVNKLYEPENLQSTIEDSISKRGWYVYVEEDLSNPISVAISKNDAAAEDPESYPDEAYVFDVVPAGKKIRLKERK